MTTQQCKPFYVENLEDMTLAAVQQQAKIWCDAIRAGRWDNGDVFQGVVVAALNGNVRDKIKPEHIAELEQHIVECTLSLEPLDDHEAKYASAVPTKHGEITSWRRRITVDYHACGVLAAALKRMGDGERGSIGSKLNLLVPCKSDTEILCAGVVARLGYSALEKPVWSTLREVDPREYRVVNRYNERHERYTSGWAMTPTEGELAWIFLDSTSFVPTVRMQKFIGYCNTPYLFDVPEYDRIPRYDGDFAFAARRVVGDGYLALVVKE